MLQAKHARITSVLGSIEPPGCDFYRLFAGVTFGAHAESQKVPVGIPLARKDSKMPRSSGDVSPLPSQAIRAATLIGREQIIVQQLRFDADARRSG
jgi:hypothetical protein